MRNFYTTLALLFAALLIFTIPAFSEGTVGITLNTGGGNTDIGLLGSYDTHTPIGELEVDGNLTSGNGIDATADAQLTLPVYGAIGLRPYVSFIGKGTAFDTVGGNFDGGLAGNLKIGDAEVGIGVFGRASAEFAPTLRDELLAGGINGVTADMLTDPALDAPATDGLPILKPNTPLHFTAYTGFEWKRLDIGLKWLGEASLDTPINQFRMDIGTSFDIAGFLDYALQGNIIGQTHDGTFDGEWNISSTFSRDF